MDASDPDVAARGRALFEQLRAEREGVGTGSAISGSPIPPEPPDAGPLVDGGEPLAGNGAAPSTEFVGAGNGSEIHGGPNLEIGSGRGPGERPPTEGDLPQGAPLAGPTTVSVAGDDVSAGEEPDDPAAVGGAARDDHPPVEMTPHAYLSGSTQGGSPELPSGEGAHEEAAPAAPAEHTGPTDPDPDPPDPTPAGPETFHVEHDHPEAESAATAPESGVAAAEAPVTVEDPAPPAAPSPPVSEGRARHPAADLALPRIIAVANQKGGVGKTTTAVNLGAALAELGFRTLVVDLDPQGNATTGLGINARNLDSSIYDVLMHEMPIDECIEPTSVRNLFVAPATIDLAGAEIELVPAFSRELRLKRALAEVADAYEFTIIDCPPSLGLLTVNGLAAATEVIVPIQCEYYALEGLGQLMRNVNLVQSNLNPTLLLSAIILTMYDARTKLADQVATEVRDHFGTRVCRNVVPRTVRLSEAPSFGQPIIVFDPSSRGALAYRELAKEVSGGAPQRVG